MSLIIVAVVSILGIILGKLLLRKWINHLTIYSAIMGGLIFFYELKYLPYPDVIPLAWFFLVGSFLSFLFGILTIITARKLYSSEQILSKQSNIFLPAFADDGKIVKYSILLFSFIGLFVAFQRWWVLINKFGSITDVLLNAGIIYRMNVQGEIKEFIPILPSFVYIAVFLSGVYTAYKGRFSFLTFLPFIGIVLKELTYFGRGEMLFSLLEFAFAFFLFRHLLKDDLSNRFKFSKRNAVFATTILIAFIVVSASFVRTSRGATENYSGASKELRQLEENFIISPSVYLYLSSDVGVFTKYLEDGSEKAKFGENTFRAFYYFLSKFNIVDEPNFFQKGYFIPMWTNTGTYVRELHADFGPAGVFIGPFLLGLLITWLYFKFYENKNLIVLVLLVYLYIIIAFSFLMMVTRLNQWFISQILIIAYLPIIEKFALRKMILKS